MFQVPRAPEFRALFVRKPFFVRTAGRREATINTLPECKITSVRAGQIEGRDVANDVSPSQATSQQHRAKKKETTQSHK